MRWSLYFFAMCYCTTLAVRPSVHIKYVEKLWLKLSCELSGNKSKWMFEEGDNTSVLPLWPRWIAFAVPKCLLAEWKSCNCNSCDSSSTLNLPSKIFYAACFILYLMNPSRVTFPKCLHARCKSHGDFLKMRDLTSWMSQTLAHFSNS